MSTLLQTFVFGEDAKEIYVDYCIRSNNLNPTEISTDLEIEPTRSWSKGDRYLGKQRDPVSGEIQQVWRNRPWGIWAINTKSLCNVGRVEEHIHYILNILEPNKGKIQKYLTLEEEYHLCFYIWWVPDGGTGSYEVSSDVLKRMAELCHNTIFGYSSSASLR